MYLFVAVALARIPWGRLECAPSLRESFEEVVAGPALSHVGGAELSWDVILAARSQPTGQLGLMILHLGDNLINGFPSPCSSLKLRSSLG